MTIMVVRAITLEKNSVISPASNQVIWFQRKKKINVIFKESPAGVEGVGVLSFLKIIVDLLVAGPSVKHFGTSKLPRHV